MLTPTRRLLVALLVALAAVACTPDGDVDGTEASSEPDASGAPGATEEPMGEASPLDDDQPLGDDEVTLHMADPPELPASLEGAVVTDAELRTSDASDRHVVQLVDVPADTSTLDEALPMGAVLRVPAGQTVEVGAAVDVATLDPDATEGEPGVVAEVESPCAAPCTVEGPALITVEGWMPGFGVAATWQLVVPAPIG